MSCLRPSDASSRLSGPWGPVSVRLASTSTMGRRRRAAAIASPSPVPAACPVRPGRRPGRRLRAGPVPCWRRLWTRRGLLTRSSRRPSLDRSVRAFALLCLCVRGFGEPFDRGQAPVPLGGEVGHGPGGLVETAGLYLVENLPALLAPADQPGLFEHGQMLGDR